MKRYWLFEWSEVSIEGGMNDFYDSYKSYETAEKELRELIKYNNSDEGHIIDSTTGKVMVRLNRTITSVNIDNINIAWKTLSIKPEVIDYLTNWLVNIDNSKLHSLPVNFHSYVFEDFTYNEVCELFKIVVHHDLPDAFKSQALLYNKQSKS